jgi:3-oxoacyl-[acyl-carrier-protein] synthase II
MTKKIVVTGIGATSPLGGTAQDSWTALLAGESGAHTLTHDWVERYDLPVTFAAEAKVRPEDVLERVEYKRLDPSSQFALISAREAWADAGSPDIDPIHIGVDYSTGIGGLWTLLDAWDTLREKGPRRVLPMTIPMLMPNAAAAAISMNIPSRAYARTDVSARFSRGRPRHKASAAIKQATHTQAAATPWGSGSPAGPPRATLASTSSWTCWCRSR